MNTLHKLACKVLNRLTTTGGATIGFIDHEEPTSGYAVAIPGAELRVSLLPSADTIQSWLLDANELIRETIRKGLQPCIGAWRDATTGHHYLDISVVVPSVERAREIGAESKQLAVWDLAKGEEIRL